MSKTLAEIENSILGLLQKNPSYRGFFTHEKIVEAVNEALDYISVEMFSVGDGWLREIKYIDWVAGSRVVNLPNDVAIINVVRWKIGSNYVKLAYDNADDTIQTAKGTASNIPSSFRIVQNKIYINPEPSDSGTAMIELEYSRYPERLLNLEQKARVDFDNVMLHWLKYYVANTLVSSQGKPSPFARNEGQFFEQMIKVVNLRMSVKTHVQDFGG